MMAHEGKEATVWDKLSQGRGYRLLLDAPMARFGSASTHPPVAFVLGLALTVVGCGAGTSEADDPGDRQGSEMTKESGFGGEESEGAEDVEPADHDIEVPPAP